MVFSGITGLQAGAAYPVGHAPLPNHPYAAPPLPLSASAPAHDVHRERHFRYQIVGTAIADDTDFIPHRPRRDTVPLWTFPPPAAEVPQPAPPISASKIFLKPPLSAINGRAHGFLVDALGEKFGCSNLEAEAILQRTDEALYKAWSNISHLGDIDWRPGEQPDSPYSLAYAAGAFTSRLKRSPHLSDADAQALAAFHLKPPSPFLPDDDNRYDLYQGVLERGLHWIDPIKARIRRLSANDILQLVYHHRRPALDSRAALTQVLQCERHVLIDEAALIYLYTQTDLIDIDPSIRIDAARQKYANALAREWLDASLQLRLLPSSPVGLDCYAFWFDGQTVPNGYRKSLEQIVSEAFAHPPCAQEDETLEKIKHNAGLSRLLFGQPDHLVKRTNWEELVVSIGGKTAERYPYPYRDGTVDIDGWRIDRDEMYTLFERAMHSIGLDTVYPAGTPHHEMAAVLRQWGFAHRVALEDYNNPAELMAAFNRLQEAWRHHPRSPVSPAFLAGMNLVRRNNVFLHNTTSELSRERQALDQVHRETFPALAQAGVDTHADMQYWHQLTENSGKPEHEILADLASSPMGERLSIYKHLHDKADALLAAPETIAYAGEDDLIVRIHDYFHQHLMAHAPSPEFDETQAITRILRDKLAMTDKDLKTLRGVRLHVPSLNGQSLMMLPVDEFRTRRQLYTSMMQHGDNVIAAADEWNTAQTEAIKKMAMHPVVVAKSRDLLRRRGKPYSEADVDTLAESQAANIVDPARTIAAQPHPLSVADWEAFLNRLFGSPTLSTIVNAFASGNPREIAGLFPFVIPIFDIAEGVWERDWDLALKGVIDLGVDAAFTLAGAGMEAAMARSVARATEAMQLARAATPLTERVGVDSLREIGSLLPQFAETDFGGLPRVTHHDAFEVHAAGSGSARQTIPKAIEASGRAQDGPPMQLHHLDVEGESIIATPTAHGYTEVNYRGELVPGAPPIFTDPTSGENYRLTREFGLPEGIAGVTEAQLAERGSVSAIAGYWATIDVPAMRKPSPAPLDLIRSMIQPNDHPQHAVLENLLVDAYTRSETFRVIVNDAFDRAPYNKRRCVVSYDTHHAHQYEDQVDFMVDKDLFKLSYTGPAGNVPFQVEREMLHEMLHFFTRLLDAPSHEAHNHRGGNIALLEKVINEMLDKPPYPPRLCYRKQGTFNLFNHPDGSVHTNSAVLRQLHDWSIAEDRYLDRILDKDREFPDTMYAMGQKITERATVRQGIELAMHLSTKARKLSQGSIAKIIPVIFDSFDLPSERHKIMLRNWLSHSKTFQRLAVAWEDKSRHTHVKITMMPENSDISRLALRKRVSHITSLAADRIWLNRGPLYYFSVADTTEVSEERVLLDALLDLFVNAIVPNLEEIRLDETKDRGISVLLSNAIMRQMADGRPLITVEPDRICRVLTSDEDAYLTDNSALSRALVSENGYLFGLNKFIKTSSIDDEEAELRRCAAEQGPRYSLFSCLGGGGG